MEQMATRIGSRLAENVAASRERMSRVENEMVMRRTPERAEVLEGIVQERDRQPRTAGRRRRWRGAAGVLMMLSLLMLPLPAAKAAEPTGALPPDGTLYGLTLTDCAAAWVQWFCSIPVSASPILDLDKTGERAGVGQRRVR